MAKKWRYHQASDEQIISVKRHKKRGRPTAQAPQEYESQIKAQSALNQSLVDKALNQRSCFVLATNLSAKDLPMDDVLTSYKGQDKTEI